VDIFFHFIFFLSSETYSFNSFAWTCNLCYTYIWYNHALSHVSHFYSTILSYKTCKNTKYTTNQMTVFKYYRLSNLHIFLIFAIWSIILRWHGYVCWQVGEDVKYIFAL
jgi:hypothetical protein